MISVVIPTLDAEGGLAETLSALVPAVVDGCVREVIVVDGGSTDRTVEIAEGMGARILRSPRGRGDQLKAGAAAARFPWLLFVHADTVLDPGWEREAATFAAEVESGTRPPAAAAFRFALDDHGFLPRLIERAVGLRVALFALPYGDQGLFISRQLYDEVGGYRSMPLMEDVDLVRRLGRRGIVAFESRAVTSAVRYRRDGYVRRSLRNSLCLALYFLGVPGRVVARLYR